MKIQNQTAAPLVIHDTLNDSESQWQSGVKNLTLMPLNTTGDTIDIVDSIAAESVCIQNYLADGSLLMLANSLPVLGTQAVPGMGVGNGVVWDGVVKCARHEAALHIYRIVFGAQSVGDEVADRIIYGTSVHTTTGNVKLVAGGNIVGTVAAVIGTAAVSGHVMVTFTGVALDDQAAYKVYARLA